MFVKLKGISISEYHCYMPSTSMTLFLWRHLNLFTIRLDLISWVPFIFFPPVLGPPLREKHIQKYFIMCEFQCSIYFNPNRKTDWFYPEMWFSSDTAYSMGGNAQQDLYFIKITGRKISDWKVWRQIWAQYK